MKSLVLTISLLFFLTGTIFSQNLDQQIDVIESQLEVIRKQEAAYVLELEDLKLNRIQRDLNQQGLPKVEPGEKIINHLAYLLVYDENHEQAKWVAHIITPDVLKGSVGRTNDFRPDSLVSTGTAVEKDYFLKYLQPDSTYEYDGFGYDRGHLAPSADFRWSAKALSESYLYSNMSPQVADFNRGKWAQLESLIRGYIYRNPGSQLYVVTGPVLKEGLPVIERSINKVSIPELYFKVVVDLSQKKAIGFLMPNKKINYPIGNFAFPIDEIEQKTGLDFFYALDDDLEQALESQKIVSDWIPEMAAGDVDPIYAPSLPRNTFNTVQSKLHVNSGKQITVCGTVVSVFKSSKGNVFLNLDKQFPNQVFTVFIRKKNLINFSYDPELELNGKQICVSGQVTNFNGTPTMEVDLETDLRFYIRGAE